MTNICFVLELLIKSLPITEYHYENLQTVQTLDQSFFKDDFITDNPNANVILNSMDSNIQSIEDNIYANVENLYATTTPGLTHDSQPSNNYDQCQFVSVPSYTPNHEMMTDPNSYKNDVSTYYEPEATEFTHQTNFRSTSFTWSWRIHQKPKTWSTMISLAQFTTLSICQSITIQK